MSVVYGFLITGIARAIGGLLLLICGASLAAPYILPKRRAGSFAEALERLFGLLAGMLSAALGAALLLGFWG